MKKGISPVVAVVLLIAIAVIAAVGVWYWVGAYTGEPNVTTDVKTFTISQCNGTHVYIQNTGSTTLNTNITFYDSSSVLQGYITFGTTSVAADSASMVALHNTSYESTTFSGNYRALSSGIQEIPFSC